MLVQLAAEPIDLRFINAQATQNEVFLCRVPRRPRVVEAEEIDKRLRVRKKKQPSGFSSGGPPRQPSQRQLHRSTKNMLV
jgi:hypothetical protein